MSYRRLRTLLSTLVMILVLLSVTAAGAQPSGEPGQLAVQLPPTQGIQDAVEPVISGLRILCSSSGLSMVTYKANANLSPGVSAVYGLEEDAGTSAGSILVRCLDGSGSVETVFVRKDGAGARRLGWQVLSKDGGPSVFEVTYVTTSIRWAVTGYLITGQDMKAELGLFLSIENDSDVDYKEADFVLYGTEGAINAGQTSKIAGLQLWNLIKPVGQALDINAGSDLRLPLLTIKGIAYRTYVGASLGPNLKGYLGKQITKETIRPDIFLETAADKSITTLPSKAMSFTVYVNDGTNGKVPANTLLPSSVQVVDEKLVLKIDTASEIVAEIERLDSKVVGTSSYEESFRIRVKSTSQYPTEAQFIESFPGEWELISYIGGEWQKSGTGATIKLTVPAKGSADTMYKVRYTYSK